MTLLFIRIFFVVLSTIAGYYIGSLTSNFQAGFSFVGASVGLGGAILLVILEILIRRFSIRNLSAAVFGLVFGFFMAWLLTLVLKLIPMDEKLFSSLRIGFILVFCYLGMVIALRGKDEFNIIVPYVKFQRQDQTEDIIIVDTSVIIDGRIADLCETNFIEGKLVIPRFVLRELQHIADSSDSLRRNRGRRGLDILNKIQKTKKRTVRIHEEDFLDLKEVDAKIIKLAKMLSAKVLTNDFNLNKIAELQGVKVLNINDLANALKPILLPGEKMQAKISKEGKEHNQGIAYLDDGTMIVVDNARYLIGKTVNVTVTSVLQTAAGRMIFAEREDNRDRNQKRNHS